MAPLFKKKTRLLLLPLVALAACNSVTLTELHHEDAMSIFEYAGANSDVYVEVIGNPTGGGQEALNASILSKFDSNWQRLRARFKTGTPPADNPYKIRMIMNTPQDLASTALCRLPASSLSPPASAQIEMTAIFCGPGPLSELRSRINRPAGLDDPALQKALNFLAWQFVIDRPNHGQSCEATNGC